MPASTTKLELITPARAEKMLKLNKRNRRIRTKHVLRLARQIERGEWQPDNPDPIVVNGRELLDGQHRLAAVIEADKPIKVKVMRGASRAVMATMDTGLPRTFADMLRMEGEQYALPLSGVVRQVWLFKHERIMGKTPLVAPSNAELRQTLEEHPELRDITKWFTGGIAREFDGFGSVSVVGAAYWAMGEIDQEDAEAFMEHLITGTGLEPGSPILALRRLMVMHRHKPTPKVLAACIFKAWNAWRDGDDLNVVYWRGGGSKPEPFPVLR